LIRAHKSVKEGFKILFNGKVVAVFSSSHYCEMNNSTACIKSIAISFSLWLSKKVSVSTILKKLIDIKVWLKYKNRLIWFISIISLIKAMNQKIDLKITYLNIIVQNFSWKISSN
jgi:hypothetical protein